MFDLVISGGYVIGEESAGIADVAVQGEAIAQVAARIPDPARRRIEAGGLHVLPGLIDPHVHLGLPAGGAVPSDDVSSGTRAALHGGVTTVLDFSLQRSGQRLTAALDERIAEFAGRSSCDFGLHANLTDFPRGFREEFPRELDALSARGCASLKIFTTYSGRGMMIPETELSFVLREAAARGFLVLAHAEDDGIVNAAADRLAREGRTSVSDYPRARPVEAEVAAIARLATEAARIGARLYLVHVSTGGGVAAVSGLRDRAPGLLHLETCPQYLFLTEEEYRKPRGHRFVVTPPLRPAADRDRLRQALRTGAIDVVATDHCPFGSRETDRPELPCTALPSGLPGIETRLPLIRTLLSASEAEPDLRLVELLAARPAKIFGLYPRKGTIRPGADADLVLLDPAERWTIQAASLHMRIDHTPYEGLEVQGRVRRVLLRGRVVLENGEVVEPPRGLHLRRVLGPRLSRPRDPSGG